MPDLCRNQSFLAFDRSFRARLLNVSGEAVVTKLRGSAKLSKCNMKENKGNQPMQRLHAQGIQSGDRLTAEAREIPQLQRTMNAKIQI